MAIDTTFLITGANSGFGYAIARAAVAAGHRVIGTVRSPDAAAKVTALDPDRAAACSLDVTDFAAIPDVVAQVERDHGPVDVLVNNAGYGQEGILEETPLDEVRRQFDVNVFGAVAMAQAVIPSFRKRRSGLIVNITSMGGFITMPGIAAYCGSKFALQGISEVMRSELAPFGVRVTAVAPGSFRTDWAGRSMVRTPRRLADYDSLFDPIREARIRKSGNQAGDPDKLAQVVVDLAGCDNPPPQLLLGSDALGLVRDRLKHLGTEIDAWEAVTRSTDG